MSVNNYFKVRGFEGLFFTFGDATIHKAWETALRVAGGDRDKVWVYRAPHHYGPWWGINIIGMYVGECPALEDFKDSQYSSAAELFDSEMKEWCSIKELFDRAWLPAKQRAS